MEVVPDTFEKRSVLLSCCFIAIGYHFWVHRAQLLNPHTALALIVRSTISLPWSQPSALDNKVSELRVTMVKRAVSVGSHLLIFGFAIVVVGQFFDTDDMYNNEQFSNAFFGLITQGLLYYATCRVLCDTQIALFESSWVVDIVFAIIYGALIVRVLGMNNDAQYFVLGGNRVMLRILVAVFHMDPLKAAALNLIVSVVVMAKCEDNMSALSQGSAVFSSTVYRAEVAAFVGITFVCSCTHFMFRACLSAQIQAETAHRAVHHLLTVLCDAVVGVGPDGKINKPTPHFTHLLSLDSNTNCAEIEFREYLATKADQQAVDRVLKAVEGPELLPSAVHVHMRRRSGLPVSVQLLFATLPDLNGKSGYLIGIREMAPMAREAEVDTPGPPKKSLRQRRDAASSSSSSSVSSVQHKIALKELDSIKLKFDVLTSSFTLQSCSIDFTGKSGRHGSLFSSQGYHPVLEKWMHPDMWKSFKTWTQEYVNAARFGTRLPERFGPVIIQWPFFGERAHLAAQSIALAVMTDASSQDSESEDACNESTEIAPGTSEVGTDSFVAILKLTGLTQLSGYSREGLLNVLHALRPITENNSEG